MNAYNIDWWGNGYFRTNKEGHIEVCPDPDNTSATVDLQELVASRVKSGQRLPALLAFPQILAHRLRSINRACARARSEYGYSGNYLGHLKISVVPIATSAKNPCTPKEEKWQVLYPMDL